MSTNFTDKDIEIIIKKIIEIEIDSTEESKKNKQQKIERLLEEYYRK